MFLVARTESNEPNKRVIMCQILKTESLYIHLNLCLYIINFLHSTPFYLFKRVPKGTISILHHQKNCVGGLEMFFFADVQYCIHADIVGG